ncbi:MAG TPA: NAD-dependent epimerase/dehydratase family protein [Acidimicrobiales bacterium]|nr:NAD-dependent epimerase/dehydratase family protein [Acidimicrobiales bacterium]
MRYLVTGSAGFIGRHVCSALLSGGNEVVGVDCYTEYYDPVRKRANTASFSAAPAFTEVELDLTVAPLDDLLDGVDAVVHLAGQPGVRLSWAEGFATYVDRNVNASQRLLEAARRTRVPRVVLASSSSVYGNAAAYPVTEDSPTAPFSPYGVTKLAMEHLAGAYVENWKLPVVLLRYFTVYGPAQRPDMALHRFIASTAAGELVPVYGDGLQVRDFTYVGDVAAATIAATVAEVAPGTVLNIAGGSSATVAHVLDLVGAAVGRDVSVERLAPQPGDVRVTGAAIDRAHDLLGWAPEVPLDEGVARQVEHHLGAAVAAR